MEPPTALALKMKGLDRYHAGKWMEAFELLDAAWQIDPDFVEDHFNAAFACTIEDSRRRRPSSFEWQGTGSPKCGVCAWRVVSKSFWTGINTRAPSERRLSVSALIPVLRWERVDGERLVTFATGQGRWRRLPVFL